MQLGGYVIEFNTNLQENNDILDKLRGSLLNNKLTRSISLEFCTYNANLQLLTYAWINYYQTVAGLFKYEYETNSFYQDVFDESKGWIIFFECILNILIIYYIILTIQDWWKIYTKL